MKKILMILLLVSMIGLVGCGNNAKTFAAYFDMPCEDDCSSCNKQKVCDDICDNSGIRITMYDHNNKVLFKDGSFVCKCI